MKKQILLLAAILCSAFSVFAQTPPGTYTYPQSSSSGGVSSAASLALVTNGLLAEYQIQPTDTLTALKDYSSNANNCGALLGTIPNGINATYGGVNFTGTGAITCPAALNSALTIQVFADVNINQFVINPGLMVAGTVSPGTGLGAISVTTGTNSPTQNFGALRITTGSGCLTCFSGGNQYGIQSRATLGSTPQLVTFTMEGNTNGDQIWVGANKQNNNFYSFDSGTSSAGRQTTGVYSIGGNTTGLASGSAGYWYGNIYWVAFYNRVLTAPEVAQNFQYSLQLLQKRNIPTIGSGDQTTIDDIVCDGSSITEGFSITTPPCQAMALAAAPGSGTVFQSTGFRGNIALGGGGSGSILASQAASVDPYFMPKARNVYIVETGVNDASAAQVAQNFTAIAQHARQVGFKIIFKSMISLSSGILDAGKNQVNTWARTIASNPYQDGPTPVFDALSDVGQTPLGADGASANANLMVGLHPTQASAYNFITPVDQGAVAFLYGNNNWPVATTYTTTNAAAVAITASSESGNDMTFTTTLNPNQGDCVIVTGVTPAGYNSTTANFTMGCWFVTSSSNATTFHAFNQTTGLGVGTVFGTAQNQQDQDVDYYAVLGGAAAGPIHILRSCLTRSGRPVYRMITNTNATPWVITPLIATETINGAATMNAPIASATNHPVLELKPILVSSSAAGCTWQASIK
jgi:hypothetical protein